MYTLDQTEKILKDIHLLLDDFHEFNDKKKDIDKNANLRNYAYANALRKACVEIGYLRYNLIRRSE